MKNEKYRREQVSIYQMPFSSICKELAANFYQWLSPSERSRAQSFVRKQDQENFVTTYGILRLIISHHGHLPPKDICIHRSTYGKPYVDLAGLYFNLSHTKNMLVIAVSNGEVGVDVEYINPKFRFKQVLGLILCNEEKRILKHTPFHKQRIRFFEYWTAKEAILKCVGIGFGLDPTTLKLVHSLSGGLQSLSFPQIKLQPLQLMDDNFVGYLAYTNQNSYIVYQDSSMLMTEMQIDVGYQY